MNKEKTSRDWKSLFFWTAGTIFSFIPVRGEYPMALGFFAAAFAEGPYRMGLSLVYFCCVLFRGTSLLAVKYALVGLIFMGILSLAERRRGHVSYLFSGLLMGGLFLVITLSGSIYTFSPDMGTSYYFFEALFIAALAMLFRKLAAAGQEEKKGKKSREFADEAEKLPIPGRERILEGARALKRLSKTFFSMPDYQEQLSKEEMEHMFGQLEQGVCLGCSRAKKCWVVNSYRTYLATEELFCVTNSGDWKMGDQGETAASLTEEPIFLKNCLRKDAYLQAVCDLQEKAKLTLLWRNRLAESRMAVAGQLLEMSEFLSDLSKEVYGRDKIESRLANRLIQGLAARNLEIVDYQGEYTSNGVLELSMYLKARRGGRISVREIEKEVSRISGRKMTALRDGRRVVNARTAMLTLKEEPSYNFNHGVARAAKDKAGVSGDNFTVLQGENGKMLIGLSDGMGSGVQAEKDSGAVMDLVEQFFEAGFRKETMVNLINATCFAGGEEPVGATVDLCTVDLYEGTYEFLKQGAVSSFLLTEGKVEQIEGHSMPMGLYAQDEFAIRAGQFGKEAYFVMVSDGVLDAFHKRDGEFVVEDILLEEEKNPKVLANRLLEEALIASNGRPRDDMTVLVLGVWK